MHVQQSAFTLVELVIVLSIFAAVSIWQLQKRGNELNLRKAAITAVQFARYSDAVAEYVRTQGMLTPSGQHTHTAWLKSRQDCPATGQANHAYLPCTFPDRLPFQLHYQTTITRNAGRITAVTQATPTPLQVNGRQRDDLMAEIVAQAIVRSNQATHIELSARKIIQSTYTSTNNPDRFLRLDGSNQMQADLHLGNQSIVDTQHVEFGHSLLYSGTQADAIELGGRGGSNIPNLGRSGTRLHPGSGQPHIDFHHGNRKQEDFNVRIVNNSDGALQLRNSAGRHVNLFDLPGQVVRDLRIVSSGTILQKPDCASGSSPQIFLMPVGFIGTQEGARYRTIAGLRTWATDRRNDWIANFEILPEGQNWSQSSAQLLALTKCTS